MIRFKHLFLVLLVAFLWNTSGYAAQTVRVGVYENKPKIFTGKDGRPEGIFIDVIEAIAEKEGWKLRYLPGTWAEGLQRLENSEIDLMPDVSVSKQREEIYDFNKIFIVYDWIHIYTAPYSNIETFTDLNGKVIAVLDRSIQQTVMADMINQLSLKLTIMPFPDYPAAVHDVINGKADAIVANRFFLFRGLPEEGIVPTSMIFSPTQSSFASLKGRHQALLDAIDRHMALMKNNPDSFFYQSLQKWLREGRIEVIPFYVKWILAAVSSLFIIALLFSLLLKRQVNKHLKDLEYTRGQYELLNDSIVDGFLMADADGAIKECNRACCEMLGYPNKEKDKLTIRDITPIKWHDSEKEIIENQVLKRGYSDVYRKEFTRKDGTVFPVEMRTYSIKDNKGSPAGTWAIFRDITERKRAEERIKLLNNQNELILKSAGEGIYGLDLNYNTTFINPSGAKMIGWEAEELLGRRQHDIIHHSKPDGPPYPGEDCPIYKTFKDGAVHKVTNEVFWKKDGTSFPVEYTSTPIVEDGKIIGAVVVFRDITEDRKLEAQLRQAQKMESVGQFAAGIAHDFNNILSAIIGYGTSALMKMAKDEPLRLNIEEMLVAADRAAQLTHNILAYSRKQILDRKSIDLNELILKAEQYLNRIIGEDIQINITLSKSKINILVDAGQLEQVLMNLATNARDAMPGGGLLSIATSVTELDKGFIQAHGYGIPGEYAVLSVSDSGIGMDDETRRKMFDPFFTTKEAGKGTGLGMAMVYGIIKQHNGFINVYSEPGKGTTFRIYLPVSASAKSSEKKAPEVEPFVRGGETILFAEDDKQLREFTAPFLQEFGYTVIAANDGEEAVNKFMEHKEKIQLLLFDLIMPKKSGKEAYDEIRAMQPNIKIIFISGYAPDIIQQKGMMDEGMSIISKPVSPVALLREIRYKLDGLRQ